MQPVPWTAGTWLNPPPRVDADGESLTVTAAGGSDFWRTTSYGFVRDSGHALLVDIDDAQAVEVSFQLDFAMQFDQAGVMVRADGSHWIKAGVEFVDGVPQVGAVVSQPSSDWSAAPVPDWMDREVTVRVSRLNDAVTIRARADGDWQFVRLLPLTAGLQWTAGPMTCSPEHDALTVRFTGFRSGPADVSLHPPEAG
jgi:regulation of enolase protein 1 (concanavalin A-like superfamily)